MVETKSVARRQLALRTVPDALAEIDRIVAAENRGTVTRLGNWSPGQSFHHLATWINFAYDGYPPSLRPAWIIRFLARTFMKNKFIKGPMPGGVKIPRVPGGTFGTEPTDTDAGAAELRRALERLQTAPPPRDNILLGKLTHDEWIALNLRHAELHLGFLAY